MSDNTLSFLSLWQSLMVQSDLEDAHQQTIIAYDKIRLVIHAEMKTIFEYKLKFLALENQYDSDDLTSTNAEDRLIKQKNQIMRLANLVEGYTEKMLHRCSMNLIEALRVFEDSQEVFRLKRETIERCALKKFNAAVVCRFRKWRFDEIEQLQKRIQHKMHINVDDRFVAHLANRRKRLNELETIETLQKQVSDMQLRILLHPLEARKRIRQYDENIFKKKEKIKLLNKSLKLAQRDTDGLHSQSASIKTSKSTSRAKAGEGGLGRRLTIYEQIIKASKRKMENQDTKSSTTADDNM